MFSIVPFIIWLVAGILVLIMDKVPKGIYAITWACLMVQLFANCVEYIK